MKIKIAGRHTGASPALRDYVIEKTEALERFFDRIVSVDVVLSVERERQIADFHAHLTNRKRINAREESTDMYASIDKAIDRLKRQLIKFKDQLQEVKDRSAIDVQADESEEEIPGKRIIRSEAYFPKPIAAEEAALQLEAIDKEFLVFIDIEVDQIAIIYRRRDGNFGLIEPRR
ncbi:ribosome-associated translation inhibitor RaiA [Candidatus Bipolaricaulota bacterium]|nr:ribosome-associated translation inhibitor RaiA [Candidatus Bipolaricaulota bacterium]MCK5585612.1 ribosome-associated translation inhibitor RaiA [Candidatus Bipolaricaulota bacterium]